MHAAADALPAVPAAAARTDRRWRTVPLFHDDEARVYGYDIPWTEMNLFDVWLPPKAGWHPLKPIRLLPKRRAGFAMFWICGVLDLRTVLEVKLVLTDIS